MAIWGSDITREPLRLRLLK